MVLRKVITGLSRFGNSSIPNCDFSGLFFPNRYFRRMDSFSEEFKSWMDSRNYTAESLAPILGRSPQTIANWRSIGVPERESIRLFLSEFMATYRPGPAALQADYTVRIEFTDAEMADVTKACDIVSTTPRDFIRRAALHQARVDIARQPQQGKSSQPRGPHLPEIQAEA
ncbi:MAG: hypothetical protein ACO3JG_14360 [Luteolibacter sp.]